MKAFKCNRCKSFLSGVPAVHYEYEVRTMGTDPDGALCGECEEDFITWLKYANS